MLLIQQSDPFLFTITNSEVVNNLRNSYFLWAFIMQAFSIFFICSNLASVYAYWSAFYCFTYFFIFETMALTFIAPGELYVYFIFISLFNWIYIFILITYVISWIYSASLMASYTVHDYEYYLGTNLLETISYKVFSPLLVNQLRNNYNKHMLSYSLNNNFNFYLSNISYIYSIFFFVVLVYHFYYISMWYYYSFIDVPYLFYANFNNIMLYTYYFIFFKLIINSIFSGQLISLNFVSHFGFFNQHTISDDCLIWDSNYWELILIYEITNVEESSLWAMNTDKGNSRYKYCHAEWLDLDTSSVYSSFTLPISWLNYSVYVLDPYNNNFMSLAFFCIFHYIALFWEYLFYSVNLPFFNEVEFNLNINF